MDSIMAFFEKFLGIIQVVVIIAIAMPKLLIFLAPILVFTSWVAQQYFRVSREIKRLESIQKSPVFILFSETIHGLSVIRAFQQEERFMNICFQRIDNMNRCFLYLWHTNRWLNIRMQAVGSIASGFIAIGVVHYVDSLSSTAAALLLIYSIEFTNYLVYMARAHSEVRAIKRSVVPVF